MYFVDKVRRILIAAYQFPNFLELDLQNQFLHERGIKSSIACLEPLYKLESKY